MKLSTLQEAFISSKEKAISGRYISPDFIQDFLNKLPSFFEVKTAGFSVENRPIFSIKFGTGKTKILMWSQMHGNESTTTKSLLDFFNFLQLKNQEKEVVEMLKNCTFFILPMLNPDGSFLWTRNNANDVDLNRDAQDLSQPESRILKEVFDDFKPDFCFNLHGQRTIYGFEKTGKPSILSFLAPSADEERSFGFSRKRSTHLISHIYISLQSELAGNIGLYDDGFNNNCVGDAFQEVGVPTILFEAGHFPGDYARERTRAYIFYALFYAIEAASSNIEYDLQTYTNIPEHNKCYCDVHFKKESSIVSYYYKEIKKGDCILFEPIALPEGLSNGSICYEVVNELKSFTIC